MASSQTRSWSVQDSASRAPSREIAAGTPRYRPSVSSTASSSMGRPSQRGGAVSVLDPKTGALLVSLPGHAERVTAVAFSDDGRVIVSGSADGTTRVWSRP